MILLAEATKTNQRKHLPELIKIILRPFCPCSQNTMDLLIIDNKNNFILKTFKFYRQKPRWAIKGAFAWTSYKNHKIILCCFPDYNGPLNNYL